MDNFDDILNTAPAKQKPQPERLSNEEYADKKQAEREALYERSDNAAHRVAGNGADFRNYLDAQSRLSRYSSVNTLLIMEVKPEATRLGDFNYWKEKGASIKANEKGIPILVRNEYEKNDGCFW
jgi:hypothetical protein